MKSILPGSLFFSSLTGLGSAHGLVSRWTAGGKTADGWDFWKKPKGPAWHCEVFEHSTTD
jgi:hypothetical protein